MTSSLVCVRPALTARPAVCRRFVCACADWDGGGATADVPRVQVEEKLTAVGEELSKFPIAPRHGRMLLHGRELGVLPHVIAAVAAISAQVLLCMLCVAARSGMSST